MTSCLHTPRLHNGYVFCLICQGGKYVLSLGRPEPSTERSAVRHGHWHRSTQCIYIYYTILYVLVVYCIVGDLPPLAFGWWSIFWTFQGVRNAWEVSRILNTHPQLYFNTTSEATVVPVLVLPAILVFHGDQQRIYLLLFAIRWGAPPYHALGDLPPGRLAGGGQREPLLRCGLQKKTSLSEPIEDCHVGLRLWRLHCGSTYCRDWNTYTYIYISMCAARSCSLKWRNSYRMSQNRKQIT